MKKQTKLFTTLSAAALLTIGVSAVSMAAGWDNSTGEWRYLNNDGTEVTDAWKSANGNWFYLNSDGVMATNQLIEDNNNSKTRYYYVDQYGAMVKNSWKAVAMDDNDSDLDAEYWWYYFGSDGKAYTSEDNLTASEIKTINGQKYAFNSEGHMLYGWIDEDSVEQQDGDEDAWKTSEYFFNGWNDGHMQTGWLQLTVEDDDETKDYWFNFKASGKKRTNSRTKINGAYYHFTENGNMITGWGTNTQSVKDSSASSTELSYLNGDGSERKNKWVWAVPDEDSIEDALKADYDDDEYSWWYFGNNGKVTADKIKKVNGKRYAFDKYGRMLKDLVIEQPLNTSYATIIDVKNASDYKRQEIIDSQWKLADEKGAASIDDGVAYDLYYFSGDEEKDGSMKKGYQTLELDDGKYSFYFNTSTGKAENGYVSKIKKYCTNGLVLAPSSDDASNYAAVSEVYDDQGAFDHYTLLFASEDYVIGDTLVNKSGTVVKNKAKLKDSNDGYYVVSKSGDILEYFESESDYDDFIEYTVTSSTTGKDVTKKAKITSTALSKRTQSAFEAQVAADNDGWTY